MAWIEFDNCRIICADCADVLEEIGQVDALVTDPPYGIERPRVRQIGTAKTSLGNVVARRDYPQTGWLDERISNNLVESLLRLGKYKIVFGGNFYSLPPATCWFVWDKQNGNSALSDCELAWTNLPGSVRIFRYMWNGFLRDGKDPRGIHPTMKPMDLMKWCIQKLPDTVETILDPFMGSGTTGVAALGLGKKFIGIEREPDYFETAKERLEIASKQLRLFV